MGDSPRIITVLGIAIGTATGVSLYGVRSAPELALIVPFTLAGLAAGWISHRLTLGNPAAALRVVVGGIVGGVVAGLVAFGTMWPLVLLLAPHDGQAVLAPFIAGEYSVVAGILTGAIAGGLSPTSMHSPGNDQSAGSRY